MFKNIIYHKFSILLLLSCIVLYISFGYDLVRTDFIKLLSLFAALFFISWKLFQIEKFNWKMLFWAGIIFRLIFLFSIPNLSQDFYRFIWDGKLLLNGVNPYLFSPNELISGGNIAFPEQNLLLEGMGGLSAGNHSNYPPLQQLLFAFGAFFTGKGIMGALITFRLLIISAEIGIFYFGRKLLRTLNLPENNIFWYFLNPLVIIELSGNLHFEAVMLFFLLWSLFLLNKGKWFWSAVLFSCAVSIKLVPLLFLPLLWQFFYKKDPQQYLNLWKLFGFYF
ncbi:MAG TPA: mannosyltransferase, partial [Salinimicrobium sp.]|nr:mannosyltransferase [Salinimicrobium sp.]